MHELTGLGMHTARRVQSYSYSLRLRKKINSEIWGSPGSRQLLHLQQFPKILKNFGALLFYKLVSSFLEFIF